MRSFLCLFLVLFYSVGYASDFEPPRMDFPEFEKLTPSYKEAFQRDQRDLIENFNSYSWALSPGNFLVNNLKDFYNNELSFYYKYDDFQAFILPEFVDSLISEVKEISEDSGYFRALLPFINMLEEKDLDRLLDEVEVQSVRTKIKNYTAYYSIGPKSDSFKIANSEYYSTFGGFSSLNDYGNKSKRVMAYLQRREDKSLAIQFAISNFVRKIILNTNLETRELDRNELNFIFDNEDSLLNQQLFDFENGGYDSSEVFYSIYFKKELIELLLPIYSSLNENLLDRALMALSEANVLFHLNTKSFFFKQLKEFLLSFNSHPDLTKAEVSYLLYYANFDPSRLKGKCYLRANAQLTGQISSLDEDDVWLLGEAHLGELIGYLIDQSIVESRISLEGNSYLNCDLDNVPFIRLLPTRFKRMSQVFSQSTYRLYVSPFSTPSFDLNYIYKGNQNSPNRLENREFIEEMIEDTNVYYSIYKQIFGVFLSDSNDRLVQIGFHLFGTPKEVGLVKKRIRDTLKLLEERGVIEDTNLHWQKEKRPFKK